MWSLRVCKQAFYVVGLLGVLVFSVPTAMSYVHLPNGELFSGLYMLGPGHMASDYPFNVSDSGSYMVYLGVGNHINSAAYYEVEVKFGNSSDLLPNDTAGVPSPLPSLYEYRVFLPDGQTWEASLNFSILGVVFDGNVSFVRRVRINDAVFDVQKTAVWDNSSSGFYFMMLAELWTCDVQSDGFGFNSRFVSLWLNVTSGV